MASKSSVDGLLTRDERALRKMITATSILPYTRVVLLLLSSPGAPLESMLLHRGIQGSKCIEDISSPQQDKGLCYKVKGHAFNGEVMHFL